MVGVGEKKFVGLKGSGRKEGSKTDLKGRHRGRKKGGGGVKRPVK